MDKETKWIFLIFFAYILGTMFLYLKFKENHSTLETSTPISPVKGGFDSEIKSAPKLKIQHQMESLLSENLSSQKFLIRKDVTEKEDNKLVASGPASNQYSNKTSGSHEAVSSGANSLIQDVTQRLAERVLDYHFAKPGFDSRPECFAQSSFKVLNKLRYIVFKSCAEKVSTEFLKDGYVLFQAAYENECTMHQRDSLTKNDETSILQTLEKCLKSIVPLKLNNNTFSAYETYRRYYQKGDYYIKKRHLTMEIPWNMVELTLAMCINAFSESPILYHKMKQAMENLFIKDLHILWENPPENALLYTRFYGPEWKNNVESLKKCVQAAFRNNPRIIRLRRPIYMAMNATNW